MARSSSMKKQFSTSTNKSCDEEKIMNYEAAWTLQENNIRLQNAERTMIKELIKILSKSSKDIKTCQKKWHKIFTDNEKNLTSYENLWYIFDTAVSSIDLFTQRDDKIIGKLKSVQSSIPNEKNHQSLKDKIQQMRSPANKLSEEITDLKKKEVKLRTQISQERTGSWRYRLRKKVLRTRQNKPQEKLKNVSRLIKGKDQSFENEETRFHRDAANIIKQNTKAELERTLSMKQQLTDFVKSFGIFPNEFQEALAGCNPREDLEQWKQNILYENAEQSFESSDEEEDHDQKTTQYLKSVKSRSTENENIDKKNYQSLKSVKSRPTENENIDKKNYQSLKSVKSRPTENENIDKKNYQSLKSVKSRSSENEINDNKKTIRQSSLRSIPVVAKNRDKKIKTSQALSEFQAVNSDDADGDN